MSDAVRDALAERLADWGSDTYELQAGEIPAAKADMRAAAAILAALAQPAEPVGVCEWTHCPNRVGDKCCKEAPQPAEPVALPSGLHHMPDVKPAAPTAPQPAGRAPTDEQRDVAIDVAMAERGYPANPRNAARAGWYAALRAHGIKSEGE